jgi:hypothetical protein
MLWPACSCWFIGAVDTVVVPHPVLASVVVQLLFLNNNICIVLCFELALKGYFQSIDYPKASD